MNKLPPQKPGPPGQRNNRPKPPYRPSIWQFLIWMLILWLIFNFFSDSFFDQNRMSISYTTFKEQLKAENVKEVTFQGNKIIGEFEKKYTAAAGAEKDTVTSKFFTTVKPDLEDKELLSLLETNNVTIKAEEDSGSWLRVLLISFLPWLLIIGIFVYMSRKRMGGMPQGGLFGIGKSKAKRYQVSVNKETYDNVAGLENAKKDLREIVAYLKEPEKFKTLGANVPKGILLVGPPGTGKTLLARATAGEADVAFFSISGSEFIEMFVGVGASRVRDLFEKAKTAAPSIIFIDELDSVGRARGAGLGGGHDEREQTLNQILSEMDGFVPQQTTIVIAATNRPDVLDPALTRPGRFDRQITLELPHKDARKKILQIHSREVPLAEEVDMENLAARTVGFSGADLKNLVNEAALLAGRKDKKKVDREDFDEARDKILLGAEREDMINEEDKKVIAYHEAGHALVAKLLPHTDPLQKVTIIPRGRSLGVTEQVPERDRHNLKRQYLMNRIAVMLGGRAAEKLVFNDVTTGAANDLKQVTQMARRMICQWGMGENIGPVYFRQGEEHLFLGREIAQQKDFSEQTAKKIDDEIRNIVLDMERKAIGLLENNREKLDRLASALLENETLDINEIEEILDSKDEQVSEKKSELSSVEE